MRGDPPEVIEIELDSRRESTPHARGSTWTWAVLWRYMVVYPACAGIHLRPAGSRSRQKSLPRMRGDPPRIPASSKALNPSTPHARGSTQGRGEGRMYFLVYPACAGIHHNINNGHISSKSLPRMRGDPPQHKVVTNYCRLSTPHARGSTAAGRVSDRQAHVYPACAGIHHCRRRASPRRRRLPRMRGDPPLHDHAARGGAMSTPHARGSTHVRHCGQRERVVYPACAGIHPPRPPT